MRIPRIHTQIGVVATSLALVLLTACSDDSSTNLRVDGSSTVGPLTSTAAELYAEESSVKVSVGTSGTGGGLEKFCNSEIAIADASRPIKDSEKQICESNKVRYTQLQVANDALTVVVHKDNDFLSCLTTEQLKKLWDKDSPVKTWNQLDESFPDKPVKLFGPGTDSGTFDYFTDEINGEEGRSRTDYTASENDNVLVQGVSSDSNALGYFGYTYFEENADKLKAVQIDNGEGCVKPSKQSAQDGSYAPLSRPLFVYVSDATDQRDDVIDFMRFYVDNIDKIVAEAKYVPLTTEQKNTLKQNFEKFAN